LVFAVVVKTPSLAFVLNVKFPAWLEFVDGVSEKTPFVSETAVI
jgi:hypothetical protein